MTSTTLTSDVDDDSSPASENDVSSDSEEDTVYGGRHSLDSSPEDQNLLMEVELLIGMETRPKGSLYMPLPVIIYIQMLVRLWGL